MAQALERGLVHPLELAQLGRLRRARAVHLRLVEIAPPPGVALLGFELGQAVAVHGSMMPAGPEAGRLLGQSSSRMVPIASLSPMTAPFALESTTRKSSSASACVSPEIGITTVLVEPVELLNVRLLAVAS